MVETTGNGDVMIDGHKPAAVFRPVAPDSQNTISGPLSFA